jgi:hypothetical protein
MPGSVWPKKQVHQNRFLVGPPNHHSVSDAPLPSTTHRCSDRQHSRLQYALYPNHPGESSMLRDKPVNGAGRPRTITPAMLRALCDRLIEKPHMYQDEMVVFLWGEFDMLVTTYSISRALKQAGWSKKTARRVAPRTKCRAARPLPPYSLRLSLVLFSVH